MRFGAEILSDLCSPGRQLIFVDESGTSRKPLLNLAGDFQLLCGVIIPSSGYPEIKSRIQDALSQLPANICEFHATEIINPKTKSPWRDISFATRLESLKLMHQLTADHVEQIVYLYASGEQFDAEFGPQLQKAEVGGVDLESALEKVFFSQLVKHVSAKANEIAIIFDSPDALNDEIKVQERDDMVSFYERGIIYADSRIEEGIQLADFSAFMINRISHSRDRALRETANAFDEFVVESLLELRPKFKPLLAI